MRDAHQELLRRAELGVQDAPSPPLPEFKVVTIPNWKMGPGRRVLYANGQMVDKAATFFTDGECLEWLRRWLLARYHHRPEEVEAVLAKVSGKIN